MQIVSIWSRPICRALAGQLLPAREGFAYSFDALARIVGRFTEVIGLDRFAIYVFHYGAPTGFRLAIARPDQVTAIISQKRQCLCGGVERGWNPIQRYWQDPTDANRQALRDMLNPRIDPPWHMRAWRARSHARVARPAGR